MVEDLSHEVIEAIKAGRKVEAIKLHRQATGSDLKDAKEAVEAWERAHPYELPRRDPGRSTNILLWAAVIAAVAWGIYQFLS